MKKNNYSKIKWSALGLILVSTLFSSCEKDDDLNTSPGGGGGSTSGSIYKGTWVRDLGASGDETDLAIGNISGEPSDRVYMCEWKGSVGLYKGTISGNIITWDTKYGLPDAEIGLESGKLTLYYPSVSYSLKTYYSSGTWTSKCGPLSNSNTGSGSGSGTGTSTGQVIFWTASDHGCGPISVSINGQSGTISSYYSSTPSCGASGCATFTLDPGTYTYSATCGTYTWGSKSVTITANSCFKMKLN